MSNSQAAVNKDRGHLAPNIPNQPGNYFEEELALSNRPVRSLPATCYISLSLSHQRIHLPAERASARGGTSAPGLRILRAPRAASGFPTGERPLGRGTGVADGCGA